MKTENGTLERTRTSRWRRRAFWLVVIGVPIVVAIAATWLYNQDKYYEQLATILPGRIFEMHAETEKRTYAPGENVVLNVSITYTAPPNAPSAPFHWHGSIGVLENMGEASAYRQSRIDSFGPVSYVQRKRSGKRDYVAQTNPVLLWPGDELQFNFNLGPATESFRGQIFLIGAPYADSFPVDLSTLDNRGLVSNSLSFDVVSDNPADSSEAGE